MPKKVEALNIHTKRFSVLLAILALIAQMFALAPAWAHPEHSTSKHVTSDQMPPEQVASHHMHGHDHGSMAQSQANADDCCSSGETCSCPAGTCTSAGAALLCQPQGLTSTHPYSVLNTAFQALLIDAPVSKLLRPPIHA